jgi:tRNA A37 threonylcarbamoyladenosine biosynthesis protein TsaE
VQVEVASASADETEAIAARLACRLSPGDVVTVSGELGTGKTTFVRGACRALGVTSPVTSPTFTIGHRYEGGVAVAISTSTASTSCRRPSGPRRGSCSSPT